MTAPPPQDGSICQRCGLTPVTHIVIWPKDTSRMWNASSGLFCSYCASVATAIDGHRGVMARSLDDIPMGPVGRKHGKPR